MIKYFLNTTDNFLCSSIKTAFSKAENAYKIKNKEVDLLQELQNFSDSPLGCMIGIDSKFETNVKLKIKLILGLFFVIVPLLVFSTFSYALNIELTYGVLATLGVAILVASRFEELSKRYVGTRILEFQR